MLLVVRDRIYCLAQVGAEYEGVSDEAAELADVCVRVRMSPLMDGSLDSLNVNVAASIVLEHVFSMSPP